MLEFWGWVIEWEIFKINRDAVKDRFTGLSFLHKKYLREQRVRP